MMPPVRSRLDSSDGQAMKADIQTAYSALAGDDGFINLDSFKRMCSSFELTIEPSLLEAIQKTEPSTKRPVIQLENFYTLMGDAPEKPEHTVSYELTHHSSKEEPAPQPLLVKRRARRSSPPAVERKDRTIHVRGRMKHIHEDSTIQKPYRGVTEDGEPIRRSSILKLAESIFTGMKGERKLQSSKGKRRLSSMPYKLMVDIATRRIVSFFRIALAKRRMKELKALKHLRQYDPGTPRFDVQTRIFVNVIEAVDLIPMDGVAGQNFSSDPFVRVELKDNYTRETDTQQKTLNPSFREEFEFWVYDLSESIHFKVLDRDYGACDDLIGLGSVPLSCVPRDRPLYVVLHLGSGDRLQQPKERARANTLHIRLLAKGFGNDHAKGRIVISGHTIVNDDFAVLRNPRSNSKRKKASTATTSTTGQHPKEAPQKLRRRSTHAPLRLPALYGPPTEQPAMQARRMEDTFQLEEVSCRQPLAMSSSAADRLLASVRELNAALVGKARRGRSYALA